MIWPEAVQVIPGREQGEAARLGRPRREAGSALVRNAARAAAEGETGGGFDASPADGGTAAAWTGGAGSVGCECDAAVPGAAEAVVVVSSSGRRRRRMGRSGARCRCALAARRARTRALELEI